MLARKNEKLVRFWQVATQPRWHVNHADTQARWHVDHVGTQAPMARDLANSFFVFDNDTITFVKIKK